MNLLPIIRFFFGCVFVSTSPVSCWSTTNYGATSDAFDTFRDVLGTTINWRSRTIDNSHGSTTTDWRSWTIHNSHGWTTTKANWRSRTTGNNHGSTTTDLLSRIRENGHGSTMSSHNNALGLSTSIRHYYHGGHDTNHLYDYDSYGPQHYNQYGDSHSSTNLNKDEWGHMGSDMSFQEKAKLTNACKKKIEICFGTVDESEVTEGLCRGGRMHACLLYKDENSGCVTLEVAELSALLCSGSLACANMVLLMLAAIVVQCFRNGGF